MLSPEQIENRRKWITALRSGKYKQGIGILRNGSYYCCLGVGCDISKLSEWQKTFLTTDRQTFRYVTSVGMMPKEVADFYGLSKDEQDKLISANDGGKTFDEIAAMIEQTIN